MKHRRVLFLLLSALLVSGASMLAPRSVQAQGRTAQQADDLMSNLRLREAKSIIDELGKENEVPELEYLRGRHAFLSGSYKQSLAHFDRALKQRDKRKDWKYARKMASDTYKVTRKYKRVMSPNKLFEIKLEKGKDEVLLPYAFVVLEQAYEVLSKEFGVRPPTPIRVEVYPRTSTLAQVSSLTEEEIRTSGTIALCKYNRLMITSPKALARGYGWVDTLVHEFVHYMIHYKAGQGVPIWMHEGLAKYLERRWRGPNEHRLPPSSEHMLRKALKKNELITFAQMHPSMAKLPSQEAAAVAFAEVYTVMEYLQKKAGEGAFKRLLDNINLGMDAKSAFAAVLGITFAAFERDWRGYLKKRPKVAFPDDAGFEEKLVFEDARDKPTELSQIPKPRARDHYRLGMLLQGRSRHGAAVVQYRKAERLMGDRNPLLQTNLAESLLAVNKGAEAAAAITPALESYPSYVNAWLVSGKAQMKVKKYPLALQHLTEAAYINPFNPEVHRALAEVYDKLGKKNLASRARRFAKLVTP